MPEHHKKRRKVLVKANALEGVDVQFISLVGRGANRIPFRVLKHDDSVEDHMNIDLKNLFRRVMKEEKGAAISGLIVLPEYAEQVQKAAEELGFETKTVTSKDEDGVSVIGFTDEMDMDNAIVLKISEEIAVVVEGVQKAFHGFPEGNEFMDNLKKAGFFPSLRVASEVLNETIMNVVHTTEKGESPVDGIDKALTEYHQYVLTLTSNIPSQAFKFEEMKLESVQKGMLISEGQTNPPKEEDVKEAKVAPKEEPKVEAKTAPAPKKSKKSDEADPEGEADEDTQSEPTFSMDEIVAKMGEVVSAEVKKVQESITALNGKVETLEETTAKMSDRVEKAEQSAQEATEAVRGTVLGEGDTPDHSGNRETRRKADPGLFDTAFRFDGYE